MSFQIRKAERKKAKIKVGLGGPSGAGKTYSALKLASGMAPWEKIVLIDTENGSGELYSSLGPYNVIPFNPPFSPQRFIEAINQSVAAGMEVAVIDSTSAEWEGIGGCLEIYNKMGGKFQDWAKITPMHDAFIAAILQSPIHIITTLRKKQGYEMNNTDGKVKVQKVGLKEIQRDGFEYELTINFDLEMNHFATASKDRTGLFMPRGPFVITEETGKEIAAWATSGAEPIEVNKTQHLIDNIEAIVTNFDLSMQEKIRAAVSKATNDVGQLEKILERAQSINP